MYYIYETCIHLNLPIHPNMVDLVGATGKHVSIYCSDVGNLLDPVRESPRVERGPGGVPSVSDHRTSTG